MEGKWKEKGTDRMILKDIWLDVGGYSITVNELYLTENSIVLDTDLLGPEKGESGGTEPSFPFIVIKTELSELPVVFQ